MKVEAITILPTLIKTKNKIRDYTIYIYIWMKVYTQLHIYVKYVIVFLVGMCIYLFLTK